MDIKTNNPNKLLATTFSVVALGGLAVKAGIEQVDQSDSHRPNRETHITRPGDTLWGIVNSREDSNSVDIRDEVNRLEKELGTTNIQPGQKIVVHTKE